MGFGNFNKKQWVNVLEDDATTISLGVINFVTATTLKHLVLKYYIKDVTSITNETVQIQLHTSDNYTRVLASSNTVLMSSMFTGTTNYIGRARFDFTGVALNPTTNYYLSVKTTNYTRNADTSYFSIFYDLPFPVHLTGAAETAETVTEYAKEFQLFGES